MINGTKFYSLFKAGLLLVLSLLCFGDALADVIITADEYEVCGGHPIVIRVQRTGVHASGDTDQRYIELRQSTKNEDIFSENSFTPCKPHQTATNDDVYFIDMDPDADQMYIWPWYTENSGWSVKPTSTKNIITITRKKEGCPAPCYTSATGDNLSGTDFNLPNNATPNNNTKLNEVEQHFTDNHIVFSENYTNYQITDKVSDFFDGYTPKADIEAANAAKKDNPNAVYHNSYYTVTGMQGKICNLQFTGNKPNQNPRNDGTFYRFNMRSYIMNPCGGFDGGAELVMRTGHGTVSNDKMLVVFIDDITGDTIKKELFDYKENNQVASLSLDKLDFWSSYKNKVIRMDVTYYGQFPYYAKRNKTNNDIPCGINENGCINVGNTYQNVTANEQDKFELNPEIQLKGCKNQIKIAIDYISAEVQNICMDYSTICLGESKTVRAVGFPKKPESNLTWWQWIPKKGAFDDRKSWVNLELWGHEEVELKPTKVGVTHYRVVDWNHTSQSVDFSIAVEECTPARADNIVGPDFICIPADNDVSFSAPYLGTDGEYCKDPKALYRWNIRREKDNSDTWEAFRSETFDKNTQQYIVSEAGKALFINDDPSSTTYGKIKIHFNDDFPEGEFWLNAHLHWNHAPVSPVHTSKKIYVYRQPKVEYKLDLPLCPFTDNKLTITSPDVANKYYYKYEWDNQERTSNSANVIDLDIKNRADKCTLSKLLIGATVGHKELERCSTKIHIDAPINNALPTIDCDKLKQDFVDIFKEYSATNSDDAIVLQATDDKVTFTLPLPVVGQTCDKNYIVGILYKGVDAYGNNYDKYIEGLVNKLTSNQLTVTLPVTAGKEGNNGFTFTYFVKDGCHDYKNSCSVKVIIRDVDAPVINCETVYNSINSKKDLGTFYTAPQEGCSVKPGYNAGNLTLPVLVPPTASENGHALTVTYAGRLENPSKEPDPNDELDRNLFDGVTVKLNDPYNIGTTYILWKFEDAAKNATYCTQKLTVINDKVPNVVCNAQNHKMSVGADDCILSFADIFNKIPLSEYPKVTDPCTQTDINIEKSRLFWKESTSNTWSEISEMTDYPTKRFVKGKTYDFEWRFYVYDPNNNDPYYDKTKYASCPFQITVVDSVPPVVNCDVLKSIAVPFNNNSKYGKNSADENVKIVYDYASAELPDGENCYCNESKYYETANQKYYGEYNKYTLEGFFDEDNYVFPVGHDNCDLPAHRKITLNPAKNGNPVDLSDMTEDAIRKFLKKYKFLEGTSEIVFEFSDDSDNKTICTQNIIVYSGLYVNCPDDITLSADKDCNAVYKLDPKDVTTAKVTYVREFWRKDYSGQPKCTAPKLDDLTGLKLSSDSMSSAVANQQVDVYPISVTKYKVTGNGDTEPAKLVNKGVKTKKELKIVGHMYASHTAYTEVVQKFKDDIKNTTDPKKLDSLKKEQQIFLDRFKDITEEKNKEVFTLLKTGTPPDQCTNTTNPAARQVVEYIELQTTPFDAKDLSNFLSFDKKGTYKLTWEYTDGQGSKEECSQIITVVDDTKPAFVCGGWGVDPEDGTTVVPEKLVAGDDCKAKDTYGELTIEKLGNDKLDNCTENKDLNISYSLEWWKNTSGSKLTDPDAVYNQYDADRGFAIGTNKITWTISDEAGNKKQCVTTIIVEDKTAPTVNCTGTKEDSNDKWYDDITVAALNEKGCHALAVDVFGENPTAPVILNNDCSPVTGSDGNKLQYITAVGSREDGAPVFSGYYAGETVVTWTFTDAAGNKAVCKQMVIVEDKTGPNIICDDLNANLSYTLNGECKAPATAQELKLTEPKAWDNCSESANITFENDCKLTEFPVGETIIHWIAKDDKGNISTDNCPVTITVIDNTAPTGDCPQLAEQSAALNACEKNLEYNLLTLDLEDNCDGILKPHFDGRSDGKDSLAPYPVGTTTIYWLYKDKSDNSKRCPQEITIKDVIAPVATCHDEKDTVKLEIEEGKCELPVYVVADAVKTYLPTAIDQCDSELDLEGYRYFLGKDKTKLAERPTDESAETEKYNDATVGPYKPGYYVIKFVFSDDFGNKAYCYQDVYIRDMNKPEVNCNDLVNTDVPLTPDEGKCDRVVTLNDLGAKTEVVATDKCPWDGSVDYVATPHLYINGKRDKEFDDDTKVTVSSNVPDNTLTIDWIYTSVHGIEKLCRQIVTVTDNQLPKCTSNVVTVHTADMTPVSCSAAANIVLNGINATDNCGVKKYEYFLVSPPKKDDGNDDTADDTNGSNDVPGDAANPGDGDGKALSPYTLVEKDFTLDDLAVGIHTIYWVLTDLNGNVANAHTTTGEACTTTINVVDNSAPTCEDITLGTVNTLVDATECSHTLTLKLPDAKDNCEGNTVTYYYNVDGKQNSEGNPILIDAATKLDVPLAAGEDHVISWYLSDGTVLSSSPACSTTVSIKDATAPTCDNQIIAETYKTAVDATDCSVDDAVIPLALNARDNCSGNTIKYSYKVDDLSSAAKDVDEGETFIKETLEGVGTHTIYWYLSDGTNPATPAVTCSTIVTVEDKTKPVLTCPTIQNGEETIEAAVKECSVAGNVVAEHLETMQYVPSATDPCVKVTTDNPGAKPTMTVTHYYINKEGEKVKVDGAWNSDAVKYETGHHILEFVFTDENNNSTDPCEIKVFIKDMNQPVITCEQFITSPLEINPANVGDCEIQLKRELLQEASGYTGVEYCDNTVSIKSENVKPYYYNTETQKRTEFTEKTFSSGASITIQWVFLSETGIENTCDQVVNFVDDQNPTCTGGTKITAYTNDKVAGDVTADCTADVPVTLSAIGAEDNCANNEIKYAYNLDGSDNYTSKDADFKLENLQVGEYTIYWQLTDKKGNHTTAATCTTKVEVKDNTNPTCENISLGIVETLHNAANCEAEITLKKPTATDNCSNNTISFKYNVDEDKDDKDNLILIDPETSLTVNLKANSIAEGNEHNIYWYLSDGINDYVKACSTTVTVVDKTAPTCVSNDLGTIHSEETACEVDHEVDLDAIHAEDNCEQSVYSYSYKVVSNSEIAELDKFNEADYTEYHTGDKVHLVVGDNVIYWMLKDELGNKRLEACSTTVKVDNHVKPTIDCSIVAKADTIKVDDCGPTGDGIVINAPKIANPCPLGDDDKFIVGHTTDPVSGFQLGTHNIHWVFSAAEGFENATCDQTITVLTNKKLEMHCPEDKQFELKNDSCIKIVKFKPVTAIQPCTVASANELIAKPYVNNATTPVEPDENGDYKITLVPGDNTILWIFNGDASIMVKPIDTCVQKITVGNGNEPIVPCSLDKVEKTIDGCTVDAAELDFHNSDVSANQLCSENEEKVIPSIWRSDWIIEGESGHQVVNDPKKLGTFAPGKYTVYWEYIFNPAGLGEIPPVGCEQEVEIKTTMPLVAPCETDTLLPIERSADANCQFVPTSETFVAPTTKDPCNDTVIVATADRDLNLVFDKGTTTITWTFDIKSVAFINGTTTCKQDVIVTDQTAPTITCQDPINHILARDENTGLQTECDVDPTEIGLNKPSVSDNCTKIVEENGEIIDNFSYSYDRYLVTIDPITKEEVTTVQTDQDQKFTPGNYLIVWTVKDEANNPQTCSTRVAVKDTVTPKIDECPSDIKLNNIKGLCEANADIDPGSETYTRKDQCNDFVMIPTGERYEYNKETNAWDLTDKKLSDPYPVGATQIKWTYADEQDNKSYCYQNIIVADTSKPVVNCPNKDNPINKELTEGLCSIEGATVIEGLEKPTATDQCGEGALKPMTSTIWYLGREGDSTAVLQKDAEGNSYAWHEKPSYNAGYYEIHFVFADTSGNSDSCIQKIFIKDTNKPDLDNCEQVTDKQLTPAAGECDFTASLVSLNNYEGQEHCTGVAITGTPYELKKDENGKYQVLGDVITTNLLLHPNDTIVIRWVYSSQMEVDDHCDQMVTLLDNQKPVLPCAVNPLADIKLTAEADKCEISAANANIVVPEATDNCGNIEGVAHRYEYNKETEKWELTSKTIEDAFPTGTTKIWWVFADSNPENTDSCEQNVFVAGSVAPEVNCDTIKPLFDTIPECDVDHHKININIPVGFDRCAGVNVPGVPSRSDNKELNDFYPLGNTTITWTFTDTTGSASVPCEQVVNRRTQKNLIMNCPTEPDTFKLADGQCEYTVTLAQQFAQHPCFNDVKVQGVPYLNKETTPSELERVLPGGDYTITWVFTDVTESLVKPIDTCYQHFYIGNDNMNDLPCKNEKIEIALDRVCSVGADEIDLKNEDDIEVDDICNGDKKAVLKIWRKSWVDNDGNFTTQPVDKPELLGTFGVGRDTVIWEYTFNPSGIPDNYVTAGCEQPIWIRDKNVLEADCQFASSSTTLNAGQECELPMDAVLDSFGTKRAYDKCIEDSVIGVPHIVEGDKLVMLPSSDYEKLKVGDTITIKWMFANAEKSADTVYCEQIVTAVSTKKPTDLKCDSLNSTVVDYIAKEACSYTFGDKDFKAPVGKDACTGTPVTAVGHFQSNMKPVVGSELEVGHDTIIWVFTSPFSTVSDSCFQPIRVLDSGMIDKHCLPDEHLTKLNAGKGCEIAKDALIAGLETPAAEDKCTGKTIKGEPFLLGNDGKALPVPESIKVGDTITILWLFNDPELNKDTVTCKERVTAYTEFAPVFDDCDKLKPLEFVAEGECEYNFKEADFTAPVGKDACTGKPVTAVGYFKSNKKEVVGATLMVGPDTIVWVFDSPTSVVNDTCEQPINVLTDKKIDGQCTAENYPAIEFNLTDGKCSVSADDVKLKLTAHEAVNPCLTDVKIQAVGVRSDNMHLDSVYKVGVTTINWTFTDTTNTLVDPVSVCPQTITVTDMNTPVVDCPKAFPTDTTKLFLDAENCTMYFAAIPVNLSQVPTHPCTGAVATVDTVRVSADGETDVHKPYGIGEHELTWIFKFKNEIPVECKQKFSVVDTTAPYFDCSTLKDTITVELLDGNSVSYDDLVNNHGFKVPVAEEKCSQATTTVKRVFDGKEVAEKADFEFGITDITFTFTDEYNNTASCHQVVNVVDMIPPVVNCPSLSDTVACITDTAKAYATYQEFLAAGGSVDPVDRVDPSTFRHEDVIDGDGCYAEITRNYYFTTIRNAEVKCKVAQKFVVKDTIAPVFTNVPESGLSTVKGCDEAEDIVPPAIEIEDCDPDAKLVVERKSTQGNDPGMCDYYTYDVVYNYYASDRCGNKDTLTYTFHVMDTVAPEVDVPAEWNVAMHPIYLKSCVFAVPDITDSIPLDLIRQNCGTNEYITFRQEPEAGTIITESVDMKLHITDVCGNDSVLTRHLIVQDRKDIAKVIAKDVAVCADESAIENPRSDKVNNSLSSSYIRESDGLIWVQEFDGEWVQSSTNFLWDYYRDTISPQTIVYSTNELTYSKQFADASTSAEAFAKYNLLLRRTQSDYYVFVAYDSISGCSDTARIYIDVMEKPRLAMESGEWKLCEGDSLAVNGDFGSQFPVCINEMGSPVTDEGWNIYVRPAENETKRYEAHDTIGYDNGAEHVAAYFATNQCGTTTTLNSLAVACDGSLGNGEDSLKFVDGPEDLELLKADKYITSDSVFLNVYTHYDAGQVLLTVNPTVKPRVWDGERAELIVSLPYEPEVYKWMQVVDEFDGEQGALYDRDGNIVSGGSGEDNDIELDYRQLEDNTHFLYKNRLSIFPSDTTLYYVVVGNGVCPSVNSNVSKVDVVHDIPTAITPYDKDGLNDEFMPGHYVKIFNRYGQLLFESNNGWDGTYRGIMADPGVYFYELEMKSGKIYKGSLELVKVK